MLRLLAGAGLSRVVVGAGASVTGHGMVRESVVFPGATATAPLDRALVSALHQVSVPLASAQGKSEFEG